MRMRTVRTYMAEKPITIGANQPLARAHTMMRDHKIRHLPVLRNGELVGIVSDRDLRFIESLMGVDPLRVPVEEAMTPEPFTIGPNSSLEWVAMEMAQHKYGATIVVEEGKVVGVFTTVDALRALQDLLAETRRHGSSHKVA